MRIGLDTNVLVYAEGLNGAARKAQALDGLASLGSDELVLPVQVLGELFAVLTRKAGRSAAAAREAVRFWEEASIVSATTASVLADAMELVATHRLSFWDAVVVAAVAEAGCRVLLSEDMQHGFVWRSVAIRNPFTSGFRPQG